MKVAIGQIWQDNDKRMEGRKVQVIGFDGKNYVKVRNRQTGLTSRIATKRLLTAGARGYTCISEKPVNAKKLELLSVKAGHNIVKQLQARASKYANGNLSAWLRYTGLMYTPRKGEKISYEAA